MLAAGVSRRFGAANKLLAPIAGRPLLAHTLARLTPWAGPIVVVIGHQAARVRAAMHAELGPLPGVGFVYCRAYRRGMAHSIRTGIAALPPAIPKALLCLGDMPLAIDARLIRQLDRRWPPGVLYVRPIYDERPGHPVLVSRRMFLRLKQLDGERGAQPMLARVAPRHRALIPWGRSCLVDADTPRALRGLSRALVMRRQPDLSHDRDKSLPNTRI